MISAYITILAGLLPPAIWLMFDTGGQIFKDTCITSSGWWWFGTFLFFSYIGKNHPKTDFHLFHRGRYTINQMVDYRYMCRQYDIDIPIYLPFSRAIGFATPPTLIPNSWRTGPQNTQQLQQEESGEVPTRSHGPWKFRLNLGFPGQSWFQFSFHVFTIHVIQ